MVKTLLKITFLPEVKMLHCAFAHKKLRKHFWQFWIKTHKRPGVCWQEFFPFIPPHAERLFQPHCCRYESQKQSLSISLKPHRKLWLEEERSEKGRRRKKWKGANLFLISTFLFPTDTQSFIWNAFIVLWSNLENETNLFVLVAHTN